MNHRVCRGAYTSPLLLRHNGAMSAILYPIAANADAALARPVGRAARASDAQALAQGAVEFAVQPTGPAFATEAEALAAWKGRVDDLDAGKFVQPENRFCTLREVVAEGVRRKPRQAKATMRDGRRWSEAPQTPATVWRLSVGYWRILGAREVLALDQARKARKRKQSEGLDAAALLAMAHQPLIPVEPQKALDIGLFEFRPPEAPHLIIPDE